MWHDVTGFKKLDNYRLELEFDNGRKGVVDLASSIDRGGVFSRFADKDYFNSVEINRELGVHCLSVSYWRQDCHSRCFSRRPEHRAIAVTSINHSTAPALIALAFFTLHFSLFTISVSEPIALRRLSLKIQNSKFKTLFEL